MDVSVLSILAGATDANPLNKVVQLLSDLETKIQEGVWRPNDSMGVLWLVQVGNERSCFRCTDRAERSSALGGAARAARCHERGEESGTSCVEMFGLEQMKTKFREEFQDE